jgi:hypothetical protein
MERMRGLCEELGTSTGVDGDTLVIEPGMEKPHE